LEAIEAGRQGNLVLFWVGTGQGKLDAVKVSKLGKEVVAFITSARL
jgi:hypothetical protein